MPPMTNEHHEDSTTLVYWCRRYLATCDREQPGQFDDADLEYCEEHMKEILNAR
jgi:hypothetical protein